MPSSPDIVQKTPVFAGEYRAAVDPKKRLTIPARWRSSGLKEVFIIRSESRRCLVAMPLEVLQETGEKARSQTTTVEDHQIFKDQFFASALNCVIDSQGRMVLSEELCRFAGLEKEAMLAGSGAKFDIWHPTAWEQRRQAASSTYTTILKSLGL